ASTAIISPRGMATSSASCSLKWSRLRSMVSSTGDRSPFCDGSPSVPCSSSCSAMASSICARSEVSPGSSKNLRIAVHRPRLLSASPLPESPFLESSGIALRHLLSCETPMGPHGRHMDRRFPTRQAPLFPTPPSPLHHRRIFHDHDPPSEEIHEERGGLHDDRTGCLFPKLRARRFRGPTQYRRSSRADPMCRAAADLRAIASGRTARWSACRG